MFDQLSQLNSRQQVRPGMFEDNPPPRDIHEALKALRDISGALRQRGDDRAIFPDLYAIITELVAREIQTSSGMFWEPTFISRLAGRFAERYLETLSRSLRAEPQDCGAWDVAYRRAGNPEVPPLQHAALGISAHINFDLALGIHQVVVELGADDDAARLQRFKHDHDQVNQLLEEAVPLALRRLDEVYGCELSARLAATALPAVTRLAARGLARWREEVWDNVLALLTARGARLRQALIHRLDRRSTRTGRSLNFRRFGALFSMLCDLPGGQVSLSVLGSML